MIVRRATRAHFALAGLLVIVGYSSFIRLTVGADQPLWFDEVWTAVIAGPTSWQQFIHDCYLDLSPPLYYVVARLNVAAVGDTNSALRLPSLIFGLLTPLIAGAAVQTCARDVRWLWCALLATWLPGVWFSHDARGYALLLMLALANTVTFAALLRHVTLRAATFWTVSASALILTHYFAGLLIVAQAAIYVFARGLPPRRAWWSLLAFVPVVGWISFHLPRVAQFADPSIAAYRALSTMSVLRLVGFVAGSGPLIVATLLLFALLIGVAARSWRPMLGRMAEADRVAWLAALASVVALVMVIGVAFSRAMLTWRYVTPFVPGILLAAALIARRSGRWRDVWTGLLVVLPLVNLTLWARHPELEQSTNNFQYASDYLMHARISRLVFYWDHPVLAIEDRSQLARVGGFFFARAGRQIPVDPVFVPNGVDPNPVLLSHAAVPGSAILWMYGQHVPRTFLADFPPALAAIDPRWSCRNFGNGQIKILACIRAAAGAG